MIDNNICIALPKGRLAEESMDLFIRKGICKADTVDFSSRKLIFEDNENKISFLLIRNSDIPTYVEHGAADLGVVGKDVLAESSPDLYELMDLKFGYCRLCVAGISSSSGYSHDMKIATKYPNITKSFFSKKGISVEVIKLYGSIEIAPVVQLSDYIVDLVSTGETMRKNGLFEVETLMESTARLIANKNSTRAKHLRIKEILACLGLQ